MSEQQKQQECNKLHTATRNKKWKLAKEILSLSIRIPFIRNYKQVQELVPSIIKQIVFLCNRRHFTRIQTTTCLVVGGGVASTTSSTQQQYLLSLSKVKECNMKEYIGEKPLLLHHHLLFVT